MSIYSTRCWVIQLLMNSAVAINLDSVTRHFKISNIDTGSLNIDFKSFNSVHYSFDDINWFIEKSKTSDLEPFAGAAIRVHTRILCNAGRIFTINSAGVQRHRATRQYIIHRQVPIKCPAGPRTRAFSSIRARQQRPPEGGGLNARVRCSQDEKDVKRRIDGATPSCLRVGNNGQMLAGQQVNAAHTHTPVLSVFLCQSSVVDRLLCVCFCTSRVRVRQSE